MTALDDTELLRDAVLIVQFRDHIERMEPAARVFAELFKQALDENPPEGYVSSAIEES